MRKDTCKDMEKMGTTIRCLAAAAFILTTAFPTGARKYAYRMVPPTATEADREEEEMSRGSFMVASQCEDCNSGYRIDQISFSGFDKPQSSSTETFFITNHTDRVMTGVTLYVDYRDTSGRQLHRRFLRLSCDIPPGETRQASVKSWDTQHSFHYEKSAPSRRPGAPFSVIFDPVAFYLRF